MALGEANLKIRRNLTLVVAGGVFFAGGANAATVNDTSLASPGVYYGSGNSGNNTGWATNTSGGIELGLSTNYRYIGQAAPDVGTNTYHVNTGFYAGPGGSCISVCSLWNFEFSANFGSSGLNLGNVTTSLSMLNVGNGQSITFNPFTLLLDNSAFDGTSTRNGNVSGQQATIADIGFQNSENLAFFGGLNPLFAFDPTANDTYIVTLSVTDTSGLDLSVDETIIAGAGAAQTPLPAALPLFASGLGGLSLLGWRRKRKAAARIG